MEINFNVKVKGGKRTPIVVTVYGTSENEKVIEFANGRHISETVIASWIKEELTRSLRRVQEANDASA